MDGARGRILNTIFVEPGIHKSEICRRTGLGWGTVGYHLHKLRVDKYISTVRANGRLITIPREIPHGDALTVHALRQPPTRSILRHLLEARQGTVGLSNEFGMSRKVMRRHLSTLADAGLIARGEGHRGRFHATVKGRMTIREDAHEGGTLPAPDEWHQA